MKIVFVFKNGSKFSFKCEDFSYSKSIIKDIAGKMAGCYVKRPFDKEPFYINLSEVLYAYQDLNSEENEVD